MVLKGGRKDHKILMAMCTTPTNNIIIIISYTL
jgi:hypothetical protein